MYRIEDGRGRSIEVTAINRRPPDVSGGTTIRITLWIVLNENESNHVCTFQVDLDRPVAPGRINLDSEVTGAIRDLVNELDSLCGFVRMSAEVSRDFVV